MSVSASLDVVGIGNAIVDVLAHVDDRFLERHGLAKGAMTLIDSDRALELYGALASPVQQSGGSAANTMAGLASLGARAAYVGKTRDDDLGGVFARQMKEIGVEFETTPADSGPPTGRCLVFVTPDAQRTMQTLLGASATLGPEDLDEEMIRRAAVTYLEGYLWDPEPAKRAFLRAAELAHDAGREVALTLSDPFCVERHREEFLELIEGPVDILFANEVEACSLFREESLLRALDRLEGKCRVSVVTRGESGSIVLAEGKRYEVSAAPVEHVVDTTGAGDLYAAGFLFGLAGNRDFETCARLGSMCAAEVIQHDGARPEVALSDLVARAV